MTTTTKLTDREIDTLVAGRVMGLTVVMRWCSHDSERGYWREGQEWREYQLVDARPEDRELFDDPQVWRQLPCHLERTVKCADGSPYEEWHVIEHYTVDHNAAAQMRTRIAEMGKGGEFAFELYDRFGESLLDWSEDIVSTNFNTAFALINATPRQQCIAALRVVGVNVEVN